MTLQIVGSTDNVSDIGTGTVVPWTLGRDGEQVTGNERPERLERLRSGLLAGGAGMSAVPKDAPTITDQLIKLVHSEPFLDRLRTVDRDLRPGETTTLTDFAAPGIAQDTPLVRGIWAQAHRGATVAVGAALVAARNATAAYGLCRPPGHHAGPGWYGGYCFLNNAVLAARALLRLGAERVAIVDLDYHLGNGTLACVADDPTLPYFSIHSNSPTDFPYDFPRSANLVGVTHPPSPSGYIDLVRNVLDRARDTRPRALVVSVGYDVLVDDLHGAWALPRDIFTPIAGIVAALETPTVFVQEGGYHLKNLELAAQALAKGWHR